MFNSIIEEARYVDGLSDTASHSHNCYEIIYLKEGKLNLKISEKKYTVLAPSLIFISKLEQHSVEVDCNEYKRYYLCISPIVAGSQIGNYTLMTVLANRHTDFCHVLNVSDIESNVDAIFKAMVNEYDKKDAYSNEMQASLLCELLIMIYRKSPNLFTQNNNKSISVIWQIQERLEKNCDEHFSLEDFASEYHMSVYYLSHLFKNVTGYSIMKYLTLCRLSLSRHYLTDTNMSITEIVYNTGFSDSSNFSRLFKREMNMTPLEYRRKYKK